MITIEITVERYNWTRRGREDPGYVEDAGSYQLLVKRWKWRGITLWKRVLDREDIPTWAWIQQATLGSTCWQSKFSEFTKK